MIKAYLNYPNPHITVHKDTMCGFIQPHRSPNLREIRIDTDSVSEELSKFARREYKFQACPGFNDMWFSLDFGDVEFELAVLRYIQFLLGNQYKPLAGCPFKIHCA